MYCFKCGRKLGDGARFCSGCGASLMPDADTLGEKKSAADPKTSVPGASVPKQKVSVPRESEPEQKVSAPRASVPEQRTSVSGMSAQEMRRERPRPVSPVPEKKTDKKLILIGILGLVIVALIVALAVLLMSGGSSPSGNESLSSSGAETEAEETLPVPEEEEETVADSAETGQSLEGEDTYVQETPEETAVETVPEEAEQTEEEDPAYILPDSDKEYLTRADLEGLTQEELRLARNELYARHGRKFDDEGLQAYFEGLDWYVPSIEPEDFTEDMLSEVEVYNRDLITEYEEEMGWR